MRREIQSKLKYLGVAKAHLVIYVIKDLLGDDLAASFQNEAELLGKLNMAVESGEDIVEIRRNSGKKPKFEKFWEV